MKIITVLGTRPEIIRLSLIVNKLDKVCEHKIVHTGQNYEECLNDVFFKELGVRKPDYFLGIKSNFIGEQIGKILSETEKIFETEKPDKLLILGDTNSALVSIIAKRKGIPVYHLEAGNRCYDDRVPEEVNRRIIDHSSDVLMPYTERSKDNLVREGIRREEVFVIGNPINEVLEHYKDEIDRSDIMEKINVKAGKFILITMHRSENVDVEERLKSIISALNLLSDKYKLPIVCSLHPRTKSKMLKFGIKEDDKNIKYLTPLGFFDFVKLEKNAFLVLTDSGTVQEECCIFKVPNITIRDVTERPETIEVGSNVITGVDTDLILSAAEIVTSQKSTWVPPREYLYNNTSDIVLKILIGYNRKFN